MNTPQIHHRLVLDRRPVRRRISVLPSSWHRNWCFAWRMFRLRIIGPTSSFRRRCCIIFALMFVAIARYPDQEQKPDHLRDLTQSVLLRNRVLVLVHRRHSRVYGSRLP